MRCSIITIGTELLIGQVIDTNSAYLGKVLNSLGVQVASRFTIDDNREDILSALKRSLEDSDIVVTTGGLGPTKDDITKNVLAEFLEVSQYFDENQYELIQKFFTKLGRTTTEAHKNQCFFPEGTEFIENKMGTAQGMLMRHKGKRIISMPGVPYEMKYIMEHGVLPMLAKEQEYYIHHRTIRTAGVGETHIAEKIAEIENSLTDGFSLAYLPSLGSVRIRVSAKSKDRINLDSSLDRIQNDITYKLGDMVYGYGDDVLEIVIGKMLLERGLRLGLAESCTGGMIASKVVSISGSSEYFEGGLVVYSNELKNQLLGVKSETLDEFGAVSEEVVKEMVAGTIESLNVDIAIAVSGIAGPGGGTIDKPVGTIWICVGSKNRQSTYKLQLLKDRKKNIEYTSLFALNFLRLFLLREE